MMTVLTAQRYVQRVIKGNVKCINEIIQIVIKASYCKSVSVRPNSKTVDLNNFP